MDAFVGVGGLARQGVDLEVGVNSVARRVVNGYVGVNGIARQFWPNAGALTWRRVILPTTGYWNDIACLGSTWVAVGSVVNTASAGVIIYSTDNGEIWRIVPNIGPDTLTGVKAMRTSPTTQAFVVSKMHQGNLSYLFSQNGINWTERTIPNPPSGVKYSILSIEENEFVLTPSNSTQNSYASLDGLSWRRLPIANPSNSILTRFSGYWSNSGIVDYLNYPQVITNNSVRYYYDVTYKEWISEYPLPGTQRWDRYAMNYDYEGDTVNNYFILASSDPDTNFVAFGGANEGEWIEIDFPTRISSVAYGGPYYGQQYYYACGEPGSPAYRSRGYSNWEPFGVPTKNMTNEDAGDFTVMGYGDISNGLGRVIALQYNTNTASYIDVE